MRNTVVLIVEDEGIEALDMQRRLTGLGYTVADIVLSGEEAVEKTCELRPDLVLMDIMLHGSIDGVAAAEQIRLNLDIPIIYVTAYSDEATLQRAKITEPHGYIVKPIRDRELHIAIEMALYKHTMERKLRESERWLATTLRSIGDAVIATDTNGLVTFMNPVAEGLTGWTQEEAMNRCLSDVFRVVNRDTRIPVENPVAKVMQRGAIVGLANHSVLLARGGREVPIDDSAAPIKDEKGRVVGVILVFRDVTDREQAEAERERLLASEQAARIEAERALRVREEFIAVAAHELKTPVTSLRGYAQLLRREFEMTGTLQPSRVASVIQRVDTQSAKLARLISQLLDASVLETSTLCLTPEPTTLSELVRTAVESVRCMYPGRTFVLRGECDACLLADRLRMEQVLVNLLDNAVKFSEDGDAVELDVAADGSSAWVSIRDYGMGVPEDKRERVFERFYQAHDGGHYGGLGLGLYVSSQIVKLHGGVITCEPPEGKGARFVVRLPLANEKDGDNGRWSQSRW